MADFLSLANLLQELTDTLEHLTQLEKDKTAAVMGDNLLALQECMKQEQALVLSLRGFDRKREQVLTDLGLEQIPLRKLPEECPQADRWAMQQATSGLQNQYHIYQTAAEVSRTTLECNLHQVEKVLAKLGQEPAETPVRSMTDIRA